MPDLPFVSILLPIRNEAGFIKRSLSAVLSQDYPSVCMEVIVVDGMSNDGTRKIIKQLVSENPRYAIRMIDNPGKIVPTGLNIALRQALGEIIIRLDAHSEYPNDYIRQCIYTIQLMGVDNVGGIFITLPRRATFESKIVQALTTNRFGIGNADYRLGGKEGRADTVPYGCYRREVFTRIGWYDERLERNQDYELNRRLLKAGGIIWRNPSIKVYYYNQGTLMGLLHQAFITGQWNPWMWYLAPYSFTLRHAIPGLFVSALIAIMGLIAFIPFLKTGLVLIFIPYFILSIIASWQQAQRYGLWLMPLLPLLFFIYHLSYGIGILWGIILLFLRKSPVQSVPEPWPGAGHYRAWPIH